MIPKFIDFRDTYWGHNILSIHKTSDYDQEMLFVTTPYPKIKDLVVLSNGEICEIIDIEAKGNPKDLFNCRTKYKHVQLDEDEKIPAYEELVKFIESNQKEGI